MNKSAPRRIKKGLWIAGFLFCYAAVLRAQAPDLEFRAPPSAEDPTTPVVMRDLAERLLPVYLEPDPERYLANLSALQMAAGDYAAADVSRQALRDRRRHADVSKPVDRAVIYDIYAYAKTIEAENRVPFADAFARSFSEVISRLNDHDAYLVTRWLTASPRTLRDALQNALDQQRATDRIGQSEAVKLIWAYLAFSAYRNFGPLVPGLVSAEDHRRYTVDDELTIQTPAGTSIAVEVVRPSAAAKLTTLLEFTLEDMPNYAKECAAHGYVGVVAYVRGKHTDPRQWVPYEQDGENARAVINWIAQQPWSDGKVAMYGVGYSGFTSWSAATHPPGALKAIATSAAIAPGIDVPMVGNIFQNSAYQWSLSVTTGKASLDDGDNDDARRALDQKWYRSGRPYRDLGRLYGQPNPLFIRWLNHPSYDGYWQKMIPFKEQFAHLDIPVLTASGYFAASEPSALYYFRQHYRYKPLAQHTLIIGPYDEDTMQRGPSTVLRGYQLDSAALIDLHELRYQWFDHVLKGGATPPLLSERINYQVMGANEWRHAPSLAAMAGESLRFYLDAAANAERHKLARHKPAKLAFVSQTVKLADRSDSGWMAPTELISKSLATHNDVAFVSEPLAKATEFSGLFSGRLDFTINKMDVDLSITLYERRASGDYLRLFNPSYEFRASYLNDRAHRHLLRAGERQELAFASDRLTSRRLQAGSRLVMVLGVSKRPDREINYGTGNDVSTESMPDAAAPVKIRWYSDSYIDIPVRK